MSVAFVSPPHDGFSTLQQGRQAIRAAQQLDPHGGMALALPSVTSAMRPIPVYEWGLDSLAAGKGLETARLVAWRYLLVANNRVHHAAEIYPDAQGSGNTRFGALTTGFVGGEEDALQVVDRMPEAQQGNYELRAVRVPALYVMALWLKDLLGERDRFVVMPPVFAPVPALQPLKAADLLSLLQQLAAQKMPLEQSVTPP